MKRRVIQRVVVFLLLGAIVNVAVAWGFAAFAPMSNWAECQRDNTWRQDVTRWWIDNCPFEGATPDEKWPDESGVLRELCTVGFEVIFLVCELDSQERSVRVDRILTGLPSKSMQATRWMLRPHSRLPVSTTIVSGIHVMPPVVSQRQDEVSFLIDGRYLPLHPLWPGFAINTIFYAAILWVVFFAPGIVKRTIRRRRGLCPACAYPVGTSNVCTECGKAVAPTNRP